MRTLIGLANCARCGGGDSPCPVCNPIEEMDDDTEFELAAWELLRDTRAELETLQAAVKNLRDAKGRFHTQQAFERLISLIK